MQSIPFLGPLLSNFGNTLRNLNAIFKNGISICRHNHILISMCKSVLSCQISDNKLSLIILANVVKLSGTINILSSHIIGRMKAWTDALFVIAHHLVLCVLLPILSSYHPDCFSQYIPRKSSRIWIWKQD